MTIEIVEFELAEQHYAMDIQNAREIVEMLPITPIPRAPVYVSGMLNLRGEITTIINIHSVLGISHNRERQEQKIVVLVPDVADGANVGIIVDDVQNVRNVEDRDIDRNTSDTSTDIMNRYIKGIIKIQTNEDIPRTAEQSGINYLANDSLDGMHSDSGTKLLIWIDIEKIIAGMTETSPAA